MYVCVCVVHSVPMQETLGETMATTSIAENLFQLIFILVHVFRVLAVGGWCMAGLGCAHGKRLTMGKVPTFYEIIFFPLSAFPVRLFSGRANSSRVYVWFRFQVARCSHWNCCRAVSARSLSYNDDDKAKT